MRPPGEVHPEKGRDRSELFAACLQKIVDGFRAEFFSNLHPTKLKVAIPNNRSFSFDIQGRLNKVGVNCEVWIEAKGYDTSSGLLKQYRTFVANVALARQYHARIENDLFWFVASVPFGCDLGADLSTPKWLKETILANAASPAGLISQEEFPLLEERGFETLAKHIGILILTPELMKTVGLKQYPRPGDNIWSLTQKLYGGVVPVPYFAPYIQTVATMNNLADVNMLQIGQELDLPFLGWPDELPAKES